MFEPTDAQPSKTALVVDDDDAVRAVTVRMLDHVGIAATSVSAGEQAVSLLTEAPDAFAFVMLDLNLASLSGEGTFEQIRSVRPDIPVLFVSGDRQCEIEAPSTSFLEKPFSIACLRRQVVDLIASDGSEWGGWARIGTASL
jgi:CheY-like chemotaxis protein